MKRPDPVELVHIAIPVLAEALVVTFIIIAIFVLSVVASGRLPA